MMREVANIQHHMRPIIPEVYGRFLLESSDLEEREYADPDHGSEKNGPSFLESLGARLPRVWLRPPVVEAALRLRLRPRLHLRPVL